jgi:hypothetical protein
VLPHMLSWRLPAILGKEHCKGSEEPAWQFTGSAVLAFLLKAGAGTRVTDFNPCSVYFSAVWPILYRRFHPYRTSCIRGGTHRDLARLHRAGVKHHPQNGMNSIQLISWCSWLRPGDPMGLVQTYDMLTLQLVSRANLVYT